MNGSVIGSWVKRPSLADAGYWLHIEQVLPKDDTASLGEVAELVDEIYQTNPCTQDGDPDPDATNQATDTENAKPPLTDAQMAEIVLRQFRPGLCGMTINGDYFAQIKVAVAHPGEAYALRLTNGKITKTLTIEEPFADTIVVKDAVEVTLKFPVVGAGSFVWRGSVYGKNGNMTGPPITLSGRTLSWGGQSLTGSIAVSYTTRYDLVDVVVFGDDDGEPGECRAICFYHGLVDEIDLEPPDIDNNEGLEIYRQPFCGYADVNTGNDDNDEVTCWETVLKEYRCQCSGEIAYSIVEDVEVTCPPNIRCQRGLSKCDAYLGHRTVLGGYVDCAESSGGLDDPDYRLRICCDAVSGPKCKTTYSKNTGGVPFDADREKYYRRIYGSKLRLIAVTPDDGDCGVTKSTIAVRPKNCCDEVEPMVWDDEATPDILPHDSSIIIYATGGLPPYTFTTSSGATSFPDGRRTWTSDYPVAELSAGETFCGATNVTVTDGCSTATMMIRSDLGEWIFAGYGCELDGYQGTLSGTGSGVRDITAISGDTKVVDGQVFFNSYDMGTYFGCIIDGYGYGESGCPSVGGWSNGGATHCACADDAGLPVSDREVCLSPNYEYVDLSGPHAEFCDSASYIRDGSFISTVTGACVGRYKVWVKGDNLPMIYKWRC